MIDAMSRLGRRLRREWGVICTVAVLGLAISATVTSVVVYDAIVLRPLPVAGMHRIVSLFGLAFGIEDPVAWWSQAEGMEAIASYRTGDVAYGSPGRLHWVRVSEVSSKFFDVFGVSVAAGLGFEHALESNGQGTVVVSDDFRRAQFGKDAPATGADIRLNGIRMRVIGVAPARFRFPSGTQIWVLSQKPEEPGLRYQDAGGAVLPALLKRTGWVGRVKPDVPIGVVNAQLRLLLSRLNTQLSPRTGVNYGNVIGATSLRAVLTRDIRPTMLVLMVGTLLLLGSVLVSSTLFFTTWIAARRGELAIRQALGAAPDAIVRQLLGEAVTLGFVCGLVGLGAAACLVLAVRRLAPEVDMHLAGAGEMASLAFGIAMLVGSGCTLLACLSPALAARRDRLLTSTRGRASMRYGLERRVLRRWLVTSQVALSVVLVMGGLLCSQAAVTLAGRDLGYRPDRVLSVHALLPESGCDNRCFEEYQRRVLDATVDDPRIASAATADRSPVLMSQKAFFDLSDANARTMAAVTVVGGDYQAVMGLSLVSGHWFRNSPDARQVVINEEVGRRLWRGGDPVGRHIRIGRDPDPFQVAGVVRGTVSPEQGSTPVGEVYRSYHSVERSIQGKPSASAIRVFANCQSSACGDVAEALRVRLSAIPGLSVFRVEPLGRVVATAFAPSRLRAAVWVGYAILGLGLSIVGVGALVASAAGKRSGEMGVRSALGAPPSSVVWLLLRESLGCIIAGILLGEVIASLITTPLVKGLLFGLPPSDAPTGFVAALVLFLPGALAALVPALAVARRGASALRRE